MVAGGKLRLGHRDPYTTGRPLGGAVTGERSILALPSGTAGRSGAAGPSAVAEGYSQPKWCRIWGTKSAARDTWAPSGLQAGDGIKCPPVSRYRLSVGGLSFRYPRL